MQKTTKKPIISVVTPNYNHAHYLPDMLETTLEQSSPLYDIEIILIDDASTDNSIEVIQSYAQKYPCIKLIQFEKNQGVVPAVNKGIRAASGDYFVFRSADDVSYPGFFEESFKMLQTHPQAGISCTDCTFFTNNYKKAAPQTQSWSKEPTYFTPLNFARILKGEYIYGSTCIIKKESVWDAGTYLEDLKWSSDWFLMLTVAFRTGVCYIPKPLAGNRMDPQGYAAKGMAAFETQRPVNEAILNYLTGKFSDIKQFFALSGCLSVFGLNMAEVVLSNPKYWTPEIFALTLRPIQEWNNQLDDIKNDKIPLHIRSILVQKLKKIKALLKKKNPKIVIYGASKHTQHLLKEWECLDLPNIHKIVLSDKPSLNNFLGIRCIPISEINPNETDMIIISSFTFEKEMTENCKKNIPNIPRLTFWNQNESTNEFLTA